MYNQPQIIPLSSLLSQYSNIGLQPNYNFLPMMNSYPSMGMSSIGMGMGMNNYTNTFVRPTQPYFNMQSQQLQQSQMQPKLALTNKTDSINTNNMQMYNSIMEAVQSSNVQIGECVSINGIPYVIRKTGENGWAVQI